MAAQAVTVLKPLHGDEPGLDEALESFLRQEHDGPIQYVFGVSDATDPAVRVVDRLRARYPDHDIEFVVGHGRVHGRGNAKIDNLTSMAAVIRHDLIVLSDSDIVVDPGYLSRICAEFAEPDVGLVTCSYRGEPMSGFWSLLSTMAIDYQFLPSVLVGTHWNVARPCMGATIAMRSTTLEAIGGFVAFADHLADDYAIGEAVRATGQRVTLSPQVVAHRCYERSWSDLFSHEMRWARTIRSIDPVGFAGSLITHPLPFALGALLCGGGSLAFVLVFIATLFCRLALHREVDRLLDRPTRRWLLCPVRDALSLFVFFASYVTDVVEWRGRRYRVRDDGTMEELGALAP